MLDGIHNDDMIPGLKDIADAVHDHGGKIVCQTDRFPVKKTGTF
jgi:2,4-dienoyl-CoA reductase-like NADH-dependent reductase (Old Yellow Enzyme family)